MARLTGFLLLLATVVTVWPPPGRSGRVEGPDGPLAGAVVRFKGTSRFTRTDGAGRFVLPIPGGSERLTASLPGFIIGGGRSGETLRLRPLPEEDHAAYAWVDPSPHPGEEHRCGNCHAEMYREWRRSSHARSASGKHFVNLYEGSDWHGRPERGWSLLGERPDGSGVCASCHAPTAGEEAVYDLRQVKGVAARGVHCDYCHKVEGLGEGEIGLTHGRFLLKTRRPREGQLFFGPLDDVDRGEDAHSPIYRDSRYCSACHEGVVFGVRVYSTYSEWLESPARRAGLHCQDCHMKPTGRMSNIAPGHGGIERDPAILANHHFWDGSQLAMLRGTLRLDVQVSGNKVRTRLVAEKVGHRVPTGFIDRQLLLVVEARDSADVMLRQRIGPTLPAAAGKPFAGLPGRLHARFTRDETGRSPVPFWRALPEVEDTRLAPGRPDACDFEFTGAPVSVRVRVLHRRFWASTAETKSWPDRDLVIIDRRYP